MINGKPENGDVFKYDISIGNFIFQYSNLPGEFGNAILINEVEGYQVGKKYNVETNRMCKKVNLLIGRYI